MIELNIQELKEISGGLSTCPDVSSNGIVQSGYSLGWHIGHAIGETIKDFHSILWP